MERKKIIIKTSIIGIVVNVMLVVFKSIIGFFTNSIAIILDAINNLTDVFSSLVTIIGAKLANKAPDKEHPYGHGRIEYFTAVVIAVIILVAGAMAIKESIEKIINPASTNYSIVSLVIILVAVFAKLFLSKYVKTKGKTVNSQSLIASGEDAFMDAILSFSTLVAGIISLIWKFRIEGYLGVVIGGFIIKSAVEILTEAINSILGSRVDSNLSKSIKKRMTKFKEVQGVYDLNLHNYGPNSIVGSAHIQVRNDMTAEEIHILTREIEYEIYEKFGIALTIGIYAANDKGEYGEIKKALSEIIKKYNEVLQLHGFYVDKEDNVYFDLIIDFDVEDKEILKDEIVSKIREKYPKYSYNVIIDSDITD
ncbi:MAG: cation transporter [Clostridia bacterium]|nr:cation transporter [Clostridia bacterium]